MRLLLQKVLVRRGYTVLEATDGAQAIESYKQHRHQIDLVLIDLGLPNVFRFRSCPNGEAAERQSKNHRCDGLSPNTAQDGPSGRWSSTTSKNPMT
jgi:CheY-like chemotaxis protein